MMSSINHVLAPRGAISTPAPLMNVSIAMIVVETVFIILFYVSRYLQKTSMTGIEMTAFMPLGYLSNIGNACIGILFVKIGVINQPKRTLARSTLLTYGKLWKATELTYQASVVFPKFAILSLYIRLFPYRTVRRLTWVTGALVFAYWVGGVVVWVLMCQPFAYSWNKWIPGGRCIDHLQAYIYISIPNLVSDVAILVIPVQRLWKLNVKRSTKVGLIVTFLLGGFGFIGAIIRFVQFNTTTLSPDIALHDVRPVIWGIIEPGMYQIAATLPLLRPVLKKILGWTGISHALRSQPLDDPEANQGEKAIVIRSDDYHYMQNPRNAKGYGDVVAYTGVMRATDVSASSETEPDSGIRRIIIM